MSIINTIVSDTANTIIFIMISGSYLFMALKFFKDACDYVDGGIWLDPFKYKMAVFSDAPPTIKDYLMSIGACLLIFILSPIVFIWLGLKQLA